jgi:hypothetical protein
VDGVTEEPNFQLDLILIKFKFNIPVWRVGAILDNVGYRKKLGGSQCRRNWSPRGAKRLCSEMP